jgi:hypothetical protein
MKQTLPILAAKAAARGGMMFRNAGNLPASGNGDHLSHFSPRISGKYAEIPMET